LSTPADSVDVAALTRLLLAVGQRRRALERQGMRPNVLKLHPDTFAAVQRAVSIVYRRYSGDGHLIEGAPPKTVSEVLGISAVIGDESLARDAMQFAYAAPTAGPALVAA
jgi:hypothetical protein